MSKTFKIDLNSVERARRFRGKQRIKASPDIPCKTRKKDRDAAKEKKREIVNIKTGYVPRPLQEQMHRNFKRFNVAVCHRRFGKTVGAVNEINDQALRNPLHMPQYGYVAPTMKQARQVAWQAFLDYTSRIPNRHVNKTEATVYIRRPDHLLNGEKDPDHIKIMLVGADDPDTIRGIYLDGAVIDEYAQCDPILWGQIIRPALADRKNIAADLGIKATPPWVLFIGTPKGRNHFWRRYNKAVDFEKFANSYEAQHGPDMATVYEKWRLWEGNLGIHRKLSTVNLKLILRKLSTTEVKSYEEWRKYKASSQWFTALYKASETGILDQEEIDGMMEDMEAEEIAQELECDFAAAVKGSYYGVLMNNARDQGRICQVPYNPAYPVDTHWDIGVRDKCAIWFRQKVNGMYHYIYYYEKSGQGVPHFSKVFDALAGPVGKRVEVDTGEYLTGMGLKYGRHVWPHDGKVQEFGTGVSRQESARELFGVAPDIQAKQSTNDRIEAARKRIAISLFDEVHCSRGVECLEDYHKLYDEKLMVFQNTPHHNWSSHASDAFGYSSLDDRDSSFGGGFAGRHMQQNKPIFADGGYSELGSNL